MRPADDGFFNSNVCVGGLAGGTGLIPAKTAVQRCQQKDASTYGPRPIASLQVMSGGCCKLTWMLQTR